MWVLEAAGKGVICGIISYLIVVLIFYIMPNKGD